jgi:hypothetical protein
VTGFVVIVFIFSLVSFLKEAGKFMASPCCVCVCVCVRAFMRARVCVLLLILYQSLILMIFDMNICL